MKDLETVKTEFKATRARMLEQHAEIKDNAQFTDSFKGVFEAIDKWDFTNSQLTSDDPKHNAQAKRIQTAVTQLKVWKPTFEQLNTVYSWAEPDDAERLEKIIGSMEDHPRLNTV